MEEPSQGERGVRFGPFALDVRSGELRRNGRRIRLPEQPFQVLSILLERPGEVVTRDELRQRLWPADTFVDFDHGLNNAVKKLRDVLDDSAENPRYIETLPKRGYRFICPTERSVETAPERAAWWRRPWVVVTLAAIVVAAGLFVANVGDLRSRLFGRRVPGEIKAIAVLPLKNLSGDPGQDYLAAGMTELLITELGRVPELRVPSHQTVLQYSDSRKPLSEIAGELSVDALIEGTVVRVGDRIRITINFVQAVPERHLLAESYPTERGEVTLVPASVAQAVANEIRVKLPFPQQARPVNSEAYEAYLMGLYHFSKGIRDNSDKAKEYFEKAIEKDPAFARAYASLADLYARGGAPVVKDPRGSYWDVRPKAREYALKALELDDTLAEAHTALGWVALTEWNWAAGGQEFRRAIELNSSHSLARIWYAEYLATVEQRFPEAFNQAKFAQQLDPVSPYVNFRAGWVFFFGGQIEKAKECWRKVAELEPGPTGAHLALAQADIKEGKYEEAIAVLEQRLASGEAGSGAFVLGTLGSAYALAGQREKALKLAKALERRAERENISPEATAYIYVGLGNKDEAFACLERSYKEHRWLFYLTVNPMLEPLRSDSRFQDLLRRTGLPTAKMK